MPPTSARAEAEPGGGSHLPVLRHGLASDAGRRRLCNEDAAVADARRGLFVACDGIGGQAAGEAASNLCCRAIGHRLSRRLRGRRSLDPRTLKQLLIETAVETSDQLHRLAAPLPALAGMGCTLVAALVDARSAYVLHAGDSRAYLLRERTLRPLTRDHTRTVPRRSVPGGGGGGPSYAAGGGEGERRLLLEYLGSTKTLAPDASIVPLEAGDRLLLCTDGLTDPVGDAKIEHLLGGRLDPGGAAASLVDAANAAGGPDNVTAVVIDYGGARPVVPADRVRGERTPIRQPDGLTGRFHAALLAVEAALEAHARDAAALAAAPPLSRLSAARRCLGESWYRGVIERDDPTVDRPAAAFHAARADPGGAWRRDHATRLEALAPMLELITGGSVRLSPLLPGDETAEVYRRLWHQWREVERRYFLAFAGDAADAPDAEVAAMLTRHMADAVRTMRELLVFLPQFLR
ncbi:PP2C family protein-serine/threonine phosphatase [Phycisphaera mikurensis]|uniref:PPM-type phosphatase domain-containing protein n=1 Tax=Phycisphaera mikurensis (strain NBRC 102666 / KCTC 22515 / FYK2301M01) TaxID=1142394 RepID=I0IJ03_PHYMF|nr:protein phosphatase 2C domain-containing protein [Phycisphaera mikurensis]MBB6443088.1 serine/threonine protein phosphatase PrpC [Phycisphaera mikurensis]BAM05241.1 putative protein phosphatase [Phycisphaera mikurensis NBRC 102666]